MLELQFRKVFFDHHKPSFPQSCSIIDAAQIRKRFQLVNPRIPDYLTDTGTDGSHILSDDRLRKKIIKSKIFDRYESDYYSYISNCDSFCQQIKEENNRFSD